MDITDKSKLNHNAYILPVLLVLMNLIFKGIYLGGNSLGGDEPFSVYISQADIPLLISCLATGNNPPLFEIILHYWIECFGISEFSVRVPSLIFSCITVLFLYKLGKKNFNIRIAIYGCLFFVFSNYQITYAHEARVYSLIGMLTAMSMYYFLEIAKSEHKTGWFAKIALLITNILLIYAHYFGFFVLLIQFLAVLSGKQVRSKHIRFWFWGVVILVLAYLPNMLILFNRFASSIGVGGTWLTPPKGVTELYNMLWKFTNAPVVTALTIILLTSAFIKYVVLLVQKNRITKSFQSQFIAGWFLLPFLGMYIISYWTPIFLDRYLMFVSVGFCLFLALVTDFLVKHRFWKYVTPIIFCMLFIITSKPNFSNKRNVREVVKIMREFQGNKGTLVLFCPHTFSLNIAYYYDRSLFANPDTENIYKHIDTALKKQSIFGINDINEIDYSNNSHVVYVDAASNFSFPDNGILDSLSQHYQLKRGLNVDEFFMIYDFEKQPNRGKLAFYAKSFVVT
jgi:hypothetical protein